MGQLKLVSELLLVTNLICISVILMILVLLPANVIAYSDTDVNCGFDTDKLDKESDPWVITGNPISERAPPQEVIWNVTTQNIKSSVSMSHPHVKYLIGLRYTTRYVYRLSNDFVNFVDKENSIKIIRSVRFTCADNEDVNVRLEFPIKDENNAPEFTAFPTNNELMIDLAETGEDTIINSGYPIIVVDKDFDPNFNKIVVTTDRPDMLLIDSQETDLPTGIGKKTDVKLKLNLTETLSSGRYIINLFASDGQFTGGASLKMTIFRST